MQTCIWLYCGDNFRREQMPYHKYLNDNGNVRPINLLLIVIRHYLGWNEQSISSTTVLLASTPHNQRIFRRKSHQPPPHIQRVFWSQITPPTSIDVSLIYAWIYLHGKWVAAFYSFWIILHWMFRGLERFKFHFISYDSYAFNASTAWMRVTSLPPQRFYCLQSIWDFY